MKMNSQARPEVKWFSEVMEKVLRENDHKGGWQNCDTRYLFWKLMGEVCELREYIDNQPNAKDIIKEAVDLANYAMMIADNAKKDMYKIVSERLWEKLEFHRSRINTSCVDLNKPFPFPLDQLIAGNPFVRDLIREVGDECCCYKMSEFQSSWAVSQFIRGGRELMDVYNQRNNTDLKPKK